MGWCYYRLGKYDQADQMGQMAVDYGDVNGFKIIAQKAAYIDHDEKQVLEILEIDSLANDLGVVNALVVVARYPGSTVTIPQVIEIVSRITGSKEIAAANILNNAGRLVQEKATCAEDFIKAFGLMSLALGKYETKKNGKMVNLHHRAALLFWISKIWENLGSLDQAFIVSKKSLSLWYKQVKLDPENQEFKVKLENAKKRVEELAAEMLKTKK